MKTKFLLSLLALKGLLLCAHTASATTLPSETDRLHRVQIGQTISALIGLDADDRILVDIAIDRALLAQAAPKNRPAPPMITAGAPLPVPPQPVILGRSRTTTPPPHPQSIGQIRKSPDRPQPHPSPPTTPK